MSKTFYYKTLRGILNQTSRGTLSVSEVINGYFFHKEKGIVSFKLSDEALKVFVYGICGRLGMRDRDAVYYNIRRHNIKDCSILEGLMVRYEKGYGMFYSYHAEQDYIPETKLVRKLLRCN